MNRRVVGLAIVALLLGPAVATAQAAQAQDQCTVPGIAPATECQIDDIDVTNGAQVLVCPRPTCVNVFPPGAAFTGKIDVALDPLEGQDTSGTVTCGPYLLGLYLGGGAACTQPGALADGAYQVTVTSYGGHSGGGEGVYAVKVVG